VTFRDDLARHVVGARALLAAALDGGDLEELAGPATPRRGEGEDDDGCGGDQSRRRQAELGGRVAEAADQRTEGDTGLEDDPGEQDHTADADDAGDRRGGLGDAEAGERDAPERPHEAQRLGQRVGEGPTDRAPPTHRRGELGDGVVPRVDGRRGDVAGRRELPHPRHPEGQPSEGEHEAEQGAPPARRALADGELEAGDADERERPPSPRWQREGDEETAGKGDERPPGCRQADATVDVVVVGRGGSTSASVSGSTRSRNTTMRSETDPGGWQANSVAEWR
jgi:hypothetical protein